MKMGMFKRKAAAWALALGLCLCLCPAVRADSLQVYCEPATAVAGETVTFHIVASNTSAYSMQNLSYSCDYTGFQFSGPSGIAAGESGSYSGSIAMTDAMLDAPITFTLHYEYFDASGLSMGKQSVSASVTVPRTAGPGAGTTVVPGTPGAAAGGVSAARKVSTQKASRGEEVTFTYTVTNGSGMELTGLSITDRDLSRQPLVQDIAVAPGTVYTFEYIYKMGGTTVNSAPVVAYTIGEAPYSVTVDEISIGMVNSRLQVEVAQDAPTTDGVLFTLNVNNNGNQKISKIQIKDEAGEKVNAETFALSVGESRTLTYLVPNDAERNVVFYISGSSASGDAYEDNTETYTVHRYIDPALIGLDFSTEVLETLNAQGSIKLRFLVKNTGSLPLQNLLLSEAQLGEIRRQESVPLGETVLEELVNVGAPRDMSFTISVQDEAFNEYTYTAHLSAALIGVEPMEAGAIPTPNANAIDEIESLGEEIGSAVSDALTVALVVLAILCVLSAAALVTLRIVEKKKKEESARRKAERARRMRAQGRAAGENAAATQAAARRAAYTPTARAREEGQAYAPAQAPQGQPPYGAPQPGQPPYGAPPVREGQGYAQPSQGGYPYAQPYGNPYAYGGEAPYSPPAAPGAQDAEQTRRIPMPPGGGGQA